MPWMGGASGGLGRESFPHIFHKGEGVFFALVPQAGVRYNPIPKLGGGDNAPEPGRSDPL